MLLPNQAKDANGHCQQSSSVQQGANSGRGTCHCGCAAESGRVHRSEHCHGHVPPCWSLGIWLYCISHKDICQRGKYHRNQKLFQEFLYAIYKGYFSAPKSSLFPSPRPGKTLFPWLPQGGRPAKTLRPSPFRESAEAFRFRFKAFPCVLQRIAISERT